MNPRPLKKWIFAFVALFLCWNAFARNQSAFEAIATRDLPVEAQQTLRLIRQGGPFPYAKDGVVFGNREGILPKQKRGYYHEYTVRTPSTRDRGARRIVAGGEPAATGEYYYTADHYATFKRIRE